MNTIRGKLKFKIFQILLESVCSSTITMGRLVENNCLEKYAVVQWYVQAKNITTNIKVKVFLTLPALSTTNVVIWRYHLDDSTKGRYNMILVRDILI